MGKAGCSSLVRLLTSTRVRSALLPALMRKWRLSVVRVTPRGCWKAKALRNVRSRIDQKVT